MTFLGSVPECAAMQWAGQPNALLRRQAAIPGAIHRTTRRSPPACTAWADAHARRVSRDISSCTLRRLPTSYPRQGLRCALVWGACSPGGQRQYCGERHYRLWQLILPGSVSEDLDLKGLGDYSVVCL